MPDLNADVTRLDADETALEARVTAHETADAQNLADLKTALAAALAAATPFDTTALEAVIARMEAFQVDKPPITVPPVITP